MRNMKRTMRLKRGGLVLLVFTIFSCITINIYFPAEKVESVASEIVRDIRGPQQGEPPSEAQPPQSSNFNFRILVASTARVWAQDAVTVSNAAIRALKAQMKERYTLLKPFYAGGSLIEKSDGFVGEGPSDHLTLKDRRQLKGLIDAENRDRRKLYQEVATALSIDPSQTGRIGEIFAEEWKKTVR